MKHFLSESAVWQTTSEFVTPEGIISKGIGESVLSIHKEEIINKSWARLDTILKYFIAQAIKGCTVT